MDKLPVHQLTDTSHYRKRSRKSTPRLLVFAVLLSTLTLLTILYRWEGPEPSNIPINAQAIVQQCRSLSLMPGPPKNFHRRSHSDRFETGTRPVLVRNATIWTGRDSGHEVIKGDLLLDGGLIKAVGNIEKAALRVYSDLVTTNAHGAWISPGIVDMHSHLGVDSAPALRGSDDTNSINGLTLPWLRSLDGLNTHDDAYQLSISGGVTTANVLPGSADAIGGQAFTIKLRPTSERSTSSMLLEPPYTINATHVDPSLPPRWRQMKHACGENPSRVYSGTRMDTIWAFRKAYETARKLKEKQDDYCAKALNGNWKGLGTFPEELEWESLVDVLRGRVKVHNHCYEAVDLDAMVRITNEFKFSIAAFHHASDTYLVPSLLKKAFGKPPAIALFATNARYKREAYRGSEFAPRILAENGFKVVMKSDHPVLNSRHLLYEAQQAHYYGLEPNLALASVISTPAIVLGLDHRIGFIKPGYDADVVIWDSHPLALGATPRQVYIDGIAQLSEPFSSKKPKSFQHIPKIPDFDQEAKDVLKYDGLPPLTAKRTISSRVIYTNVSSIYVKEDFQIRQAFSSFETGEPGTVVIENGHILCSGNSWTCPMREYFGSADVVDLDGGSISPALVTFGSPLGLEDIQGESSTHDGKIYDVLKKTSPSILGGDGSIIRALDGLQFSSRDALHAYRFGVTTGIVAPSSSGFLSGLSTAFLTGAPHKLAQGAVVQEISALHVSIESPNPSISTKIALLRKLLSGHGEGELAKYFTEAAKGNLPLVIAVQSADIMATLINLKKEIEAQSGHRLRMSFTGANEAHLLAKEIGQAGIGVILNPSRPFPFAWRSRRILAGHPLTKDNSIVKLRANNITIGIGIEEQWSARNVRFDIAWAALEGGISRTDAIALASSNLEQLLGINSPSEDLVAIKSGSMTNFDGKVEYWRLQRDTELGKQR